MKNNTVREGTLINRRQVLKWGCAAGSAAVIAAKAPSIIMPNDVAAASSRGVRQISLYQTHTGEFLKNFTYYENGDYLPDALEEANKFLRDHYSGLSRTMDKELLDILYALRQKLGYNGIINVLSAYRCKSTNEMLRRRSRGVARNSYHIKGRAIDLTIPGHSVNTVSRVARGLRKGGVGRYRKSKFVHVDTGEVRSWG